MNEEHLNILEAAEKGELPETLDSSSGINIDIFQELYESGLVKAIDASSFGGAVYINPKITMEGREYLKNNKPKNGELLGNEQDKLPEKITLAWLFHNVPYSFWAWLVGLLLASFILGVQSSKLTVVKEIFELGGAVKSPESTIVKEQQVSVFEIELVVLELGTGGSTFSPRHIQAVNISNNLNFIQMLQRISPAIEPVGQSSFPYEIYNYTQSKWVDDLDSTVPRLVSDMDKIIFVSKKVINSYGRDADLFRTAAALYF